MVLVCEIVDLCVMCVLQRSADADASVHGIPCSSRQLCSVWWKCWDTLWRTCSAV